MSGCGWIFLLPVILFYLVSDVIQYMNNKLRRPPHAPLYLYVDNDVLAGTDSTLARLYQEYRDTDYFLYISYYEGTASSSDKES